MPDHENRTRKRRNRRKQHHERQNRGTVDDQQDQENHCQGNQQQNPVDTAEGNHQISSESCRSGDLAGQTVLFGSKLTCLFHTVLDGNRGFDGHYDLSGLPILGVDHR